MPALATSYVQRPSLRPHDFLIDQRGNEARYVPSTLVPLEISGDVYLNRLELRFRYITSESSASRKFSSGQAEVEVGKFTQKILGISLTFDANYESVLASFDIAAKYVRKLRASLQKPSIQKSYEFVAEFLEQAKNDFKNPKMKHDLERMFLASSLQERRD